MFDVVKSRTIVKVSALHIQIPCSKVATLISYYTRALILSINVMAKNHQDKSRNFFNSEGFGDVL